MHLGVIFSLRLLYRITITPRIASAADVPPCD